MRTMVMIELLVIGIIFITKYIIKLYHKHKDKNKVKTVLNYLQYKTGNIEVEKLQKMLGVEDNDTKNKNR